MKRGEKYKAIIFDLDGTLIDSLHYHFLAFEDLFLERGIKLSKKHLKHLIGLPTEDILKEIRKKHTFKGTIVDLVEERRYHFFKFVGTKKIIFSGTKKLISNLSKKYKLGIATGSSYVVFSHTSDKSFQEKFECVTTINDVKKGKPNPEQLLRTAKKLKVKPNECLFIGDSSYDAVAAKRAKMDFIGVLTGYEPRKSLVKEKTIAVLKDVTKLEKFLKKKIE